MRTIEEIQSEYSKRCVALGELRWRLHVVEHQINEEIRKIEALDQEAFAVRKLSAESQNTQPSAPTAENTQE
jgi:hypothetical protein